MRRLEPLWWVLFSVGGTLAAFLLPVHIFLNNIAAPLGWVSSDAIAYDTFLSLVQNPLVKLYLIVLLATTLFLAAQRFRSGPWRRADFGRLRHPECRRWIGHL